MQSGLVTTALCSGLELMGSQCGPQTRSFRVTWELVRSANSLAPFHTGGAVQQSGLASLDLASQVVLVSTDLRKPLL